MSKSIQALRERQAELHRQMNAQLAEKGDRAWTKEDQAVFDNNSDESERLQTQIDAHQKMLDIEAGKSFDKAPRKEPEKNELRKGVELFMRKHPRELTAEEALIVRNTMSTTTASEGGNTVMPKVATELIDFLKAYGFMRRVADSITTSDGAAMSYPTSDGTSEIGEIVLQNVQAASADPTFGTVGLNVHKFGSKIITIPIELLQDTNIDIVALIYRRLRDRIGRIQNQKFTVGTGAGEPNGLVTAAGVGKIGTTGQTTTVIYDDLVDLIDSLDAAYLDNPPSNPEMPGIEPGWMFGQTMRRVIRKIKDTAGRPIWTPSYDAGLTAKTPDLLLGYPVNINNDMPTPAANAKSIAFGNLHRYMIRDAMEVSLFRFDDSAFMSKGQVGFLGWARAGGNLTDVNAVKLYQHSAT